MPVDKIAITLDRELVKEIDRGVKSGLYRNRSRAIEEAVREKLDRHRRQRLSVEAKKLDRKEERALAEEGMTGEEAGLRPVLVISHADLNRHSGTVIALRHHEPAATRRLSAHSCRRDAAPAEEFVGQDQPDPHAVGRTARPPDRHLKL